MQTIICTSGHIDHGKTSLVKALTGINTDSLPEEKSKLMTIDLGFAFLNENITIIDVPGHEKFIKNMAAGANSVNLALLAIAADDGIMPQTIEHLNIISHYGIRKCIVAITKIDTPTLVLVWSKAPRSVAKLRHDCSHGSWPAVLGVATDATCFQQPAYVRKVCLT